MHIIPPLPTRPVVLIADDEPAIADTLALILQKNGFDSIATYSGDAAFAAAQAKRPDALVVDMVMIGMNGMETALRIRAFYPGCRIILISGGGATRDLLAEAGSMGEDVELLAKPFAPGELLAKLRA
ncbi:MAG TPA: response regulator [Acidobacteriaceae bacterium]